MAASRPPPAPKPPDVGAIDEAWNSDEQPTVARPSRAPTAPTRFEIPSELPTAPGMEAPLLELDDASQPRDLQDRVTSIPRMSPDEYARLLMSRDPPRRATDAPPASFEVDAPEFGLTLESPEELPDSELPTAPPPTDFYGVTVAGLPPASSVSKISLDPGSQPTDIPPPAPPLSQPRIDAPIFSGRFSSLPPVDGDDETTMKNRFAMGDFSGALDLALRICERDPNHQEAHSLAKKCRDVLEDMYTSRIADMSKVPTIIMGPDQIRWLSLNHRSGFLLSMIDGISSVDDLMDISGMQRLDALRIVCSLLEQKVIALE